MPRCPECEKVLRGDDLYGHDCEAPVSDPRQLCVECGADTSPGSFGFNYRMTKHLPHGQKQYICGACFYGSCSCPNCEEDDTENGCLKNFCALCQTELGYEAYWPDLCPRCIAAEHQKHDLA